MLNDHNHLLDVGVEV